ncbi:MAG: condensation domain-containing protein, partial [Psychrosphaera sp.]|nr:condensation domain-containing protein [Psychrosphaera sp.]
MRVWQELGRDHLVGYFVTTDDGLSNDELQAFLQGELPEYKLPTVLQMLDELPRNNTGEIAVEQLPQVELAMLVNVAYAPPRDEIERTLAAIWSEVLGIEQVGINDNFFSIGGDSILSTVVIAHANIDKLYFTPRQLFESKTIRALAKVVSTQTLVIAEQGDVVGTVPLLPVQQWFFEQVTSQRDHFNQAVLLSANQPLKQEALAQILKALVTHHDILRSRYRQIEGEGEWQQYTLASEDFLLDNALTYIDMRQVDASQQAVHFSDKISQQHQTLSMEDGPLIRLAWFDYGPEQPGLLHFVIHHLAIDGVSWRIILTDFMRLHEQLEQLEPNKEREPVKLTDKSSSYKTWAERIREYGESDELMAQSDYWVKLAQQQKPLLPTERLPTGKAGSNLQADEVMVKLALDEAKTTALLQQVPDVYHTQINDILLCALTMAFAKWTGEQQLYLSMEGHGREDLFDDIDLSRTVGWFTTIYPVL